MFSLMCSNCPTLAVQLMKQSKCFMLSYFRQEKRVFEKCLLLKKTNMSKKSLLIAQTLESKGRKLLVYNKFVQEQHSSASCVQYIMSVELLILSWVVLGLKMQDHCLLSSSSQVGMLHQENSEFWVTSSCLSSASRYSFLPLLEFFRQFF